MKIFDAGKTRMIGLPCDEKSYNNNFKPFLSNTGTLWTDGRTDKQTDRFAISLSRVSVLTRDKNSPVDNTGERPIRLP